ncbi:MAG: universal stress protein [Desulfovibrionaceae bacterium]|jgi:nucleotide-binding universal stress UspA family protein|nr:universal stress protein [Desulfovibrionaceae bacterium]
METATSQLREPIAPQVRPETERSILITVGEEPQHLYAARFAAHFFQEVPNVRFTLLGVLPPEETEIRGFYRTVVGTGQMDEDVRKLHTDRRREALETARRLLMSGGAGKGDINVRLRTQRTSMVLDIIDEAALGGYDACALGNRGRTWLDDMLEGTENITKEIIERSCGIPLWLCRTPAPSGRDVLLCVDGSEPANRMARHVGRILGSSGAHRVTILRVRREGAANPEEPEITFAAARALLEAEGVPPHTITTRVVEDNDPARAILNEAEYGRFAVVAAGRGGAGGGLLRRLFMGSVSHALYNRLTDAALWVCC